jgi:hypothetical protein
MVGITFLFLSLRFYVRFLRRTRINLSDIFVSFSWLGFVADSTGYTLLHQLGLELSPSQETTVAVDADPRTLVQVYKVRTLPAAVPLSRTGAFAFASC